MTQASRGRIGLRRLRHKIAHYPLSSWPVLDLAGDEDAYAMQGRCDNCGTSVAIVQAKGRSIPGFVNWDKLCCPVCAIEAVYGLFDMDVKAAAR